MARSMTDRLSAGRGVLRDESGFSLMEAVVSFTLFIIMAGSASIGLVKTLQLTGVSRDRTTAAQLATQEIEKMRSQNATGHQVDSAAFTVRQHGMTYTVAPTANPLISANCATGASRQVSVIVTWNSSPARSLRYDTVLAC